jgi:hypothetical protein
MFLPEHDRPSFTPIQSKRQIYNGKIRNGYR